jgi:hypothetical protein
VSTGVNQVSRSVVDTLGTSDVIDNIEYNSDLDIGVNVLSVNLDGEEISNDSSPIDFDNPFNLDHDVVKTW